LSVIAVTGTNGKTSTAWWLAQALVKLGKPCGVMGTLGIGFPNDTNWSQTGLTTPDPIAIHHTLRQWVDQGVLACAIEASSIGLKEHRLNGLSVRIGIFTNLTQDHLDYHQTMEAYWEAKKCLFDFSSLEAAVINIDNVYGEKLAKELVNSKKNLSIWTYSKENTQARLSSVNWCPTSTGLELCLKESDHQEEVVLKTEFVGSYNISNLLGVLCTLRVLGVSLQTAVDACASLTAVPGRMQVVKTLDNNKLTHPLVMVDYAHTPDALEQALLALRPLATIRNGKLHVIIGCGGNRDITKRPLMANIAEQHADNIWLTSDNPRNEDIHQILNQMLVGLKSRFGDVHIIEDRDQAIRTAIFSASIADIILIAGKGHESTQEINGVKYPFSDVEHAQKNLQAYSDLIFPHQ
jgi:UDP-N-acetylmuramoyl-L-alanyl-D-glutamate--2,6-diaminopimelate ligase